MLTCSTRRRDRLKTTNANGTWPHHLRLAPAVTFGLYTLSDTLAAVVLNPVYAWLRTHGRRIPTIRKIGRRLLAVAMIGIRRPTAEEMRDRRRAPALFRIGPAGPVSAGLGGGDRGRPSVVCATARLEHRGGDGVRR